MKIERILMHHVRMELRHPFETSFGRIYTRDCLLLEVFAEGLVGFGECVADRDPGYSYETTQTAWHVLSDFILPGLIGRELDSPAEYQRRVASIRGHLMAKASVEMAVWDLLGKMHNKPISDLLGGVRKEVEVGVSVGIQDTPQALINTVGKYMDDGYRRIKIKIKPGRDVVETQAIRNAFPDVQLQVDANSAYDLQSAMVLKPLDELDLLLIEQPLAEDDIWDHSRLQPHFKTALCLDESILSARHARQALEMGACRIINIKAGRIGGLSSAVAIHDTCRQQGIPVWCGGMLETGVGRASNLALAALPGFSLPGDISASDRYYVEDITEERFILNPGSTITVPTGPGLGVHIQRSSLERVTLNKIEIQ
jgi:o-succinylbenzoate synthase